MVKRRMDIQEKDFKTLSIEVQMAMIYENITSARYELASFRDELDRVKSLHRVQAYAMGAVTAAVAFLATLITWHKG